MNETQKAKKKFRQSKEWRAFKQSMKDKCGKIDGITQKKLYKTWNLHHRNLDESQYTNLREDWFFPCNNMTHKFLHWLWNYYKDDPEVIDRIKAEMQKMKEINIDKN
jgi:hypothetical protein